MGSTAMPATYPVRPAQPSERSTQPVATTASPKVATATVVLAWATSSSNHGRSTSGGSSKATTSTASTDSRSSASAERIPSPTTGGAGRNDAGTAPINRLRNRRRPWCQSAPAGTRSPQGTSRAEYHSATASTSTVAGSWTSPLFHCGCGRPVAIKRTPASSWTPPPLAAQAAPTACQASPCACLTHSADTLVTQPDCHPEAEGRSL